MEGCKIRSIFSIVFISLLVLLGFSSFSHHVHHSLAHGYFLQNGFRDAADKVLESSPWTTLMNWLSIPNWTSDTVEKFTPKPIDVNLSSCGDSYTDIHRLINCCPATNDAAQPIIDFQFPDLSPRKRIRRPSHRVDAEYIAKYEKAVGILKSLPKDHPHNFWRQANMHCLYCTGGYRQQNSDIIVNVHYSWFFFPWHRALIYFHERILGKYIGDDNFALNYWQWDAPEGMTIPQMYFNGSLVDPRDPLHLPPTIADQNYIDTESGLDSEGQINYNLAFMYNQMVSGAKKPELFMGCRLSAGEKGHCMAAGTIEAAPHDTLHTWVGTPVNIERENMGAFYSAAKDPVFYAHHSNLDRMWMTWQELNGNKLEFDDSAWLDTKFYFYDENLQLVRVRVRDMLDHHKLGYDYEKATLPWLNARPKPAVSPKLAKNLLSKMINITHIPCEKAARNEVQMSWTLDKIIRVRVQRPRRHKRSNKNAEVEEILVLSGINSHGEHAKFDVFVNLVDEGKANPSVREFAGTFVSLPHGWKRSNNGDDDKEAVRMHKSHLKLGISEILHDLEAEDDDIILVTLVPRFSKRAVMSTTVDEIKIEYMA